MNLIDQLLQQAENYADQSETLQDRVSDYSVIMAALPRLFPAPDDFYIRSPEIDYDLALVYKLGPQEKDEALRLVLSITFNASSWEGELDKLESILTLRSVVKCGGRTLLIKIIGANSQHYKLSSICDVGLKLVGTLHCIKFIPWEIIRPDITPEILLDQCIESNAGSYLSSRQAKILSELATVLPTNLPAANVVTAALGLNYDADITYLNDPKGKKRAYLDRHLGYVGWAATINKKDATFSLHSMFDIKCNLGTLRVRVSIGDAYKAPERLFLVADTPDLLMYRAVRKTDQDYKSVTDMYESKHGH